MASAVHVVLAPHPANPPRFRQRIEVALKRTDAGGVAIGYAIHGFTLDLRVPTPRAPAPADALWRTTCCELFVGAPDHPRYREFNFSPSGQWAAYDFVDTRVPAPQAPACPAPSVHTRREENLLQLDVVLPSAALPEPVGQGARFCLALATILQADDGSLGYWALVHPPGAPDFHHPAGFALKLDARGLHP